MVLNVDSLKLSLNKNEYNEEHKRRRMKKNVHSIPSNILTVL